MASSQFNQTNEVKPQEINEAAPVYLPPGVANIALHLLAGDVDSTWDGDEKTSRFTDEERLNFRLFDKSIPDPDAIKIANLILRGDDSALVLLREKVKNNSTFLDYLVTGTDPLGRKVKGTLLQIAAMAGDVDVIADIKEEKDRGLVEQIAIIGNLSAEQVAEQLKVITSDEAKQANEKRSQKIFAAVQQFCDDIIENKKLDLDAFDKALIPDRNEVITAGFIFDFTLLSQARRWYGDIFNLFGGSFFSNKSFLFWTHVLGKLQSKLSARDAQIIFGGIEHLYLNGKLPARTLTQADGTSYFYNANSDLGIKFCLGSDGTPGHDFDHWINPAILLNRLLQEKTTAIQKLEGRQEVELKP